MNDQTKGNVAMAALAIGVFFMALTVGGAANAPAPKATIAGDGSTAIEELVAFATQKCPQTKDDKIGGVQVSCTFECKAGEIVFIEITAADEDAYVWGTGSCGGASASCQGDGSCSEPSSQITGSGGSGSCQVESDEAFTDPLTVNCWTEPSHVCPLPTCTDEQETY